MTIPRRLRALLSATLPALALLAFAAAPASADPIHQVLVNGKAQKEGSGLRASATMNGGTLHVFDPPSNPDDVSIVRVQGTLASSEVTPTGGRGPFGDCSVSGSSFSCEPGIGIGPGSDVTFHLTFSDPGYRGGLDELDVIFFDTCGNGASVATVGRARKGCADDKKPSHTKITKTKVHKHSVSFRFKAKHTKKFKCELITPSNKKKFSSCKSPKTYKHLKAGKYGFYVRGVNKAGKDKTPGHKTFTIG